MPGIIKSAKKTAVDEARKVAKQIRQEPFEIAKTIVPPHIIEGAKKESTSPITEAILKDQKGVEETIDKEAVEASTNKRLQELEEEIRKIRREREAKEQEWKKAQEALMQPAKPEQQQAVEAQGKKRRGFMGPGKKKQGTKEMAKQRSG